MSIDDVDLAQLAQSLRERAPAGEPRGYLRGKAALRDMVVRILGCSELEAEDLVETLESRGYLRFEGNPAERSQAFAPWDIDPHAEM
ncbi:MAG: hypothetical protein HY901_22580 [Deltaproteobacteria bacterium]|nr:hypothetical protein [Deltaproteobacteria bacterium]